MYFTKFEIITFATLLSFLILGGLAAIIAFIGTSIYLHVYNKKIFYYLTRNDSDSAMMLEGGSSTKRRQAIKFAAIIFVWFLIWFFGGFLREYADTYIQNFLSFWTFLSLFSAFLLTCFIGYKLLDTQANREAFTKREIMLAGTLFIDVTVGVYYFYHWFNNADHSQMFDGHMIRIIIHTVIFTIIAASILSLMVYGKGSEEAKDERDLLIEVKGYRYGFYALTSLIGLLIGQLAIDALAFNLWGGRVLNLNTIEVANLLWLIIILAWAVVSSAQLFFYRRGY